MGFYKVAIDEQLVMWASLSKEEVITKVKTSEIEKTFLWIFKHRVPVYEDQSSWNTVLRVYFTNGTERRFGFGNEPENIKLAEELFDRINYKNAGAQ